MAVRVITLFFLVFLSLTAFANTLTGKVVKITDGDTVPGYGAAGIRCKSAADLQ